MQPRRKSIRLDKLTVTYDNEGDWSNNHTVLTIQHQARSSSDHHQEQTSTCTTAAATNEDPLMLHTAAYLIFTLIYYRMATKLGCIYCRDERSLVHHGAGETSVSE